MALSSWVSDASFCLLRADMHSSLLAFFSEVSSLLLARSFSLLFLSRSSFCASVSEARCALSLAFLLCLASSEAFVVALSCIVKKFLLYSNFSNYKCACAYAKIQISLRMLSDVRILHNYMYTCTEISICITSVWLATLANYT